MTWAAIVGQPLAVRLLRQAVAQDKVAHAYLFVGPEGVGKRRVALELAKSLNCERPNSQGDACDHCASCRKIDATPPLHPDLAIVEPDGRFIKTDQMRDLQGEMYARPTEGKVRMAVIDGADRMNPEAANRVLKLLEEPPGHAMLILLTQNLSGVLPTLVSRCQVVNFPPLTVEQTTELLVRHYALTPALAHLYASLSGGSVGRSARMAKDEAWATLRDESCALLQAIGRMSDLDLLGRAEALEKQKDHLDDWLDLLLVWLRDALLVAQTGSEQLVLGSDRLDAVRSIANEFGPARLIAMLDTVIEGRGQLRRNANTRLVLDVMLLRMIDIAQGRLLPVNG